MSPVRLLVLTAAAMIAFAGNSILCRLALATTSIDAASFTSIRVLSGALTLVLLVLLRTSARQLNGSWWSAAALFGYAAGFSFAYLSLSAATGALVLFGAVQFTMIGYGLYRGERINGLQTTGILLALLGLVGLLLPGLSAPPLVGALLMLGAGFSWGIYSLRGRAATHALGDTAGNFLRAVPFALVVSAAMLHDVQLDILGLFYAIASGALASGMGYALWYLVLPALTATSAATIQLTVPVLAGVGGVVFLDEPISVRLVCASVAVLGGVGLFIYSKRSPPVNRQHQ